jgi:hypothetical protein
MVVRALPLARRNLPGNLRWVGRRSPYRGVRRDRTCGLLGRRGFRPEPGAGVRGAPEGPGEPGGGRADSAGAGAGRRAMLTARYPETIRPSPIKAHIPPPSLSRQRARRHGLRSSSIAYEIPPLSDDEFWDDCGRITFGSLSAVAARFLPWPGQASGDLLERRISSTSLAGRRRVRAFPAVSMAKEDEKPSHKWFSKSLQRFAEGR